MRHLAIGLCALLLCACSFLTRWFDVTGQGRDQAAAEADYRECAARAGLPPDRASHPTRQDFLASSEKFKACMTERGWKLERI